MGEKSLHLNNRKCDNPICEYLKSIFSEIPLDPTSAKSIILKKLKSLVPETYFLSYWTYNQKNKTLHLGNFTEKNYINENMLTILGLDSLAGGAIESIEGFIEYDNIHKNPKFRYVELLDLYDLNHMIAFRVDAKEAGQVEPKGVICLYPKKKLAKSSIKEIKECIDLSYSIVESGINNLKINIISKITESLISSTDRNSFIHKCCNVISSNFGCQSVSFFSYDEKSETFYLSSTSKNNKFFTEINNHLNINDVVIDGDCEEYFYFLGNSVIDLCSEDAFVAYNKFKYKSSITDICHSLLIVPVVRKSGRGVKQDGVLLVINENNRVASGNYEFFSELDISLFEEFARAMSGGLQSFRGEEIRKDIFSKISHEMHVPLEGLRDKAERLMNNHLFNDNEEAMKRHFEDIENLSCLAINLFSQFSSAKEENVNLSISKGVFLFKDIIFNCVKSIQPYIIQHSLPKFNKIHKKKSVFYEEDSIALAKSVSVDKSKITQVFFNVLSNCVKYHDRNKQNFFVNISVVDFDEKFVIVIADTGIGLEENEYELVFQKNKRGVGSWKYNVYGTGLGLYLSRLYMEQHKGNIYIIHKNHYIKYNLDKDLYSTAIGIEFPRILYT